MVHEWNSIQTEEFKNKIIHQNKLVRESGVPNAEGCKFEVETSWDLEKMDELLCDYEDRDVLKYLKYGWPICAVDTMRSNEIPRNQGGIAENMQKVNKYINNELVNKSVVGPFKDNPFGPEARFSPLGTRPKRDNPSEVRIILNLSHPFEQGSVNASIPDDKFLGEDTNLKYPGVDQLVEIIWRKGRGCKLMKRDLTKAYRQIFIDVGSVHLVGYIINDVMMFDLTLSMGLKISAYVCQRITNSLIFIYRKEGYEGINYLDDLGAAERARLAQQAFEVLGRILTEIGIWEAESKACPPSTIMTFLGLLLNTVTMTIEIEPNRLKELKDELCLWSSRRSATLREVQSLVGKLSFAATTVQAGRLFFSRILNFMKTIPAKGKRRLPTTVYKDIDWWRNYMEIFDGKSMLLESEWTSPLKGWSSDASLTGCGAWFHGKFFHSEFPDFIKKDKNIHINELECLAIVVALKLWGPLMKAKKFLAFCDNKVSCEVINTGRARNAFTQKCLREIVYLCAKNSTMLRVVHIGTRTNEIADSLSRWSLDGRYQATFRELTKKVTDLTEEIVTTDMFKFSNNW